jgi:PAS domain S-box-containing protein
MEGDQGEKMKSDVEKRNSLSPGNWLYSVLIMMCITVFTYSPLFPTTTNNGLLFLGNKNIAPVIYLDNGIPVGVAVDVVHAIAKYIPQIIEIKAMDWSEAQALVARGEADALIQINETEERKKIYDFSDSLLESHFSIFTRIEKMGISELSNLRSLKVGVESGGLPRKLIEKDPQILSIIIPNFIDGFKQLSEGSIDAVVVDYRVGSYFLAQSNIRNIKVTGDPIAVSYSCFAVKKGNIKLLSDINNALKMIKTNGTYQTILDKWKPEEVVFHTREQITQITYRVTILVLSVIIIIAIIWIYLHKKELSKRKAAEEMLKEQYSTLLGIINSADALVFSVDRHYRYTSFNLGHAAAMQALYGEEIKQGHALLEYMTVPEDREISKRNLDRALAGEHLVEEAYSGEEIRSRRYFRVSHSPIKTEEEIVGVAVLAQDITDRKLAEEALHRLNRELRAISECNQALMRAEDEQTLLDGVCHIVCGEAGYHMAWVGYAENDDAKTIRPVAWAGAEEGYLEEARITWADTERGRGPSGTAIRSDKSACIQDFTTDPQAIPWRDSALQHGYRSSAALPLKGEDGRTFGVLNLYSTEPNAFTKEELHLLEELAGDLAFGITVLRARLERSQAEKGLKASEERFRRLAENARDVIYRMSLPDGIYEYMSPAARELFGYTPEEFYSSPLLIRKVIHPDWQGYFEDQWSKLMTGDLPPTYEFPIVHKSGEIRWVNQRNLLIHDDAGGIVAIEGIVTDVTERKKTEEEIRELNEELEQRVRERTAELEEKNAELQKMNRIFVGRELRMVELKEKIKEFEKRDRPHGEKVKGLDI